MSSHADWLEMLEAASADEPDEDFLLWPRTPIADIQERIRERVGVSDLELDDRRSRPASVIRELERLRETGILGSSSSVLDLACGDALLLRAVNRRFAMVKCFGVDLLKGAFPSHAEAEAEGVSLYRVPIQRLFTAQPPPSPVDVVLMLNTYRGWKSADLRSHERSLPRQAGRWLDRYARVAIVTATAHQVFGLRLSGHSVRVLGPGEDRSRMVAVMSRGGR